ncbi:MAG: EfeM/EfeO family lipoprotein, partial [Verrucomicrobiota bacterium]
PNDDPYASLVDPGLAYFRLLADRQLPLVENLVEAIRSDDLSQALDAYVDSRPPYEQIEVLAGDFEGTDTDIDARPASFDWGETDESFKGFHRIEMLLFGEEDLNSALPYAEELVESVKLLRQNLDERERFSSAGQFGGMIGLANEIGAKKITSEEETWSDQSLLIFRHNFRGIYSQYNAYAGLVRSLNEQVATDATAAFRRAEKSVRAFFRPFSTGSTIGFSQVPNSDRREIVRASNQLRDALVASAETLDLAESL